VNRICAIDITGKVVNLLLLAGTKVDYKVLESKPLKIELKDHTDSNSIKEFAKNIDDFFKAYGLVNVAIKSGSTGMYKSGPAVFKMEAVIQMTNVNIQYVKPQTLTAFWKKNDVDIESHNLKKYQHNAFKLAYYFLEEQ